MISDGKSEQVEFKKSTSWQNNDLLIKKDIVSAFTRNAYEGSFLL